MRRTGFVSGVPSGEVTGTYGRNVRRFVSQAIFIAVSQQFFNSCFARQFQLCEELETVLISHP